MESTQTLFRRLVCPVNHLPLDVGSAEVLARLNERIAAGAAATVGGAPLTERLEMCLVRSDGLLAYEVRRGIPLMLPDQGISLE